MPGVTAGVAAPAYAGIPVTQRGMASAVAFVTGHEDPAKPETAVDWAALAAFPGTLVFYMGVRQLPRIAEQLVAAGRAADEPAAVVERGTLPDQRACARRWPTARRGGGARAPAITVVGPVAALHDELAWFGRGPLAGRDRRGDARAGAGERLAARLRALGARVVEAPAIRIEPLRRRAARPGRLRPARADLAQRRSSGCSSASATRARWPARDRRDRARAPRARCATRGIEADVVPERAVAEALAEALAGVDVRRALSRAPRRPATSLPDALRERGAEVDVARALPHRGRAAADAGARGGARRRLR